MLNWIINQNILKLLTAKQDLSLNLILHQQNAGSKNTKTNQEDIKQ